MAAVKFGKGSNEWQMFVDFWNICQDYWEPEDTDEYWEKVIDRMNFFTNKYKLEFATKMANAFIESQEKILKEKKKGAVDGKT